QLADREAAARRRARERRRRDRRRRIGHDERDRRAGGVLEAHLELAVERQHLNLVGHVGEEEHRRRPLAGARGGGGGPAPAPEGGRVRERVVGEELRFRIARIFPSVLSITVTLPLNSSWDV